MTTYVLPLEGVALLLTAAMLGAVVIAMREQPGEQPRTPADPMARKAEEPGLAPARGHVAPMETPP